MRAICQYTLHMTKNQSANAPFAQLCEDADRLLRDARVPGASLGILHRGETYVAGFGITHVDQPLPVTSHTIFQCGSITKTFVGTLAMSLVHDGKLDLDAPVRRYLPDFRLRDESVAAHVTTRHLLTHQAGWLGDYFNDLGYGDDGLAKYVATMVDLPQWMPLGKYWSYNNAAFCVAGRVIEAVSGMSFEQAMRVRVFEPLGLGESYFFANEIVTRPFAVGHNDDGARVTVARPWQLGRSNHPAGGVLTTVNDLLRFAQFHINEGTLDGKRILPARALRAMRRAQCDSTSRYKQGIAWRLTRAGQYELFEHGGATNGYTAHFRVAPAAGFAITMLTNSDNGPAAYEKVSRLALQRFVGADLDAVSAIHIARAKLDEYVGVYRARLSEYTVSVQDDALLIATKSLGGFPTPEEPPHGPPPPSVKIAFYKRDHIFAASDNVLGSRGEFMREDGRIRWLRWGGRMCEKVQ